MSGPNMVCIYTKEKAIRIYCLKHDSDVVVRYSMKSLNESNGWLSKCGLTFRKGDSIVHVSMDTENDT